jgi:ADP-heptose:LPS heptosyltransferase
LPLGSEPRAPVAFFSNAIGDRLLSLPALRALVWLFGSRLTLVCDEASAPFFRTQLALSRIIEVARSQTDRRLFDAGSAAEAIGDCDLFLSLAPWSSDALVRLVDATAPDLSVGFAPFYDVSLTLDYGKHSADLAFDVPRFLDPSLEIDDFAAPLRFDPAVRRRADRLLAPLPTDFRMLSVHADTVPEKMWASERLIEVIDRFIRLHCDFFVLVVGMNDHASKGERSHPRVANCCGLPLDLSMQLVAASDLFLGVDSCMLHAADLARVPGVGLFGPTSSRQFGFRFGRHRHLQSTSMDGIGAAEVVGALGEMRTACTRVRVPRRYRSDDEETTRIDASMMCDNADAGRADAAGRRRTPRR